MNIRRKPEWLKIDFRGNNSYKIVNNILKNNCLNTICVSGRCPNLTECWNRGTATFMILGDICTRSCRFCNTKTGKPNAVNPNEANELFDAVEKLKLRNVVLTSVDRDDLEDNGANHWARCIDVLKKNIDGVKIEALIPDFNGKRELIDIVLEAKPDILSHNIETVERLTPFVRSAAKYRRSLEVIKYISQKGTKTKSGFMLGLGETEDEVVRTMSDLVDSGCKILTIGQYLQPTKKHLEVVDYISPDKFLEYANVAKKLGFTHVESAPLVRSSYYAEKHLS